MARARAAGERVRTSVVEGLHGRLRSVAAVGLCLALSAAVAAASSEVPRAVTLAGNEVEAPDDLGERSILVLAFRRAANDGGREWRRFLDNDPRVDGWSLYSVIVLEGAPGFVRRMIARSIRGDLPVASHDSFLVVEEGADAWRELAGSNGEGENRVDAVFVVRLEDGEICARYRGLASVAALADLLGASCEG